MIKVPYEGKVALAYHHLDKGGEPDPYWDDATHGLQALLLTNLPRNSAHKTLTDLGSSKGKWPALLSPYFDQIVSIEPNDDHRHFQERLLDMLKIENIDLYGDEMPGSIKKMHAQAALLIDALPRAQDWLMSYRMLLDDDFLQWIAIAQGISDDPLSNKSKMTQGDQWRMLEMAEERGWSAVLFDVDKDAPMIMGDAADRWLLLLER